MSRRERHSMLLSSCLRTCTSAALLSLILLVTPVYAHDVPTAEDELKVAYLYNFLGLIERSPLRPVKSERVFRLCVAGPPDVERYFRVLEKERLEDQEIQLQLVTSSTDVERCDALYIDHGVESKSADLLKAVHGKGILTIGEIAGFCEQGGVINFYFEERKLRFEVNLRRAREEQIRIPAKMLKHGKAIE